MTITEPISLAHYDPDFRDQLVDWFSDPDIRKSNEIPDEFDGVRFTDLLVNNSDQLYLICFGSHVIGFVCFFWREKGWMQVPITIADRHYRGKGFGSSALKIAVELNKNVDLVQMIRPTNKSMIETSLNAGFKEVGEEDGYIRFELERSQ